MLQCVPAMRRRMLLAWLAAAGLAACSRPSEPPIGSAPAERAPPLTASVAAGPPVYVGHWAVSRSACGERGWDLTAAGLQSPSALSCEFFKAEPTSAGYTVYSTCKVGKAAQPMRLVLTLTGQGKSLTLSGGPFSEPVALARCPAGLQSASSAPPESASAPA